MNREAMVEAMVEAGARGLAGADADNAKAFWDGLSESTRLLYRSESRAVLDAVLPQITSEDEIRALPQHSLLMGVLQGGMVPNFLIWEDGNIYDLQADWDVVKPEDLISQYESVTVVWTP